MSDTILSMRGITKTFPGVKALSDVNLAVLRGEIHAICGENGAGKSTLMKVLSGVYPYGDYDGEITFDGEPCRFGGIRDSAGQGLSPNPYTWSFTAGSGSSAGPSVTKQTPVDGATAVGLATNVTATFSTAVQGVDATTFTLTPEGSTTAVPAGVTRDRTTNRWVLDPSAKLKPDTRYTATLSSGIHDSSGASLTPTSWTFLTGPAPKVSAKTPAAGATGVNKTSPGISVTFNEAVQGVDDTTFTLRAGTGAVPAAVTQVPGTNRYTLTPSGALTGSTRYTVTVTGGGSGIRDLAGNPLSTLTWAFTTGA